MATKRTHNTTTPDIETASQAYRRRFSGEIGAFLLAQQERAIRQVLPSATGADHCGLDVGGGHGQLVPILRELGYSVWVQGSSERCAEHLESIQPGHASGKRFVVSDLWSLPFPDRTFDVVSAVRLLAHVSRWQTLLGEMARVCKRFLLIDYASLFALNGLSPLLFSWKRRVEGNTRPYFSYTKGQLVAELRNLGFVQFTWAKQFLFPMGLHRALARPTFSRWLEGTARAMKLTSAFGSPVILLAQREVVA